MTFLKSVWIVAALLLAFAAPVRADPLHDLAKQQSQQIGTDQVDKYWQQLVKEYGGFFPDSRAPSLMDLLLRGGDGFRFSMVLTGLFKFFFYEIIYNGKLLASIIILTVFSTILQTMQSAFERKTVSKVAYALCYMVLVIIAINSFDVAMNYAKGSIGSMIDFMLGMIPLLFMLLASMGNLATVSLMHPLIIFMVHVMGDLIYFMVLPLLFFSAVLYIVSSLSDQYKVTQLAALLRNVAVGTLGVASTVFLAVISIEGAAGSISDGITLRTAKYVAGNFVPVVGRLFSDAADTVLGASLLVKNAVGLAGVILIVMLCVFPAVKILALALIYNFSAAVMQPLGSSPIVECLQTIGKSMVYVFAALAAVGLMFFLVITIMIAAGNVTVMMR